MIEFINTNIVKPPDFHKPGGEKDVKILSIDNFEKQTQIYKIRALTKVKSKFSKCLLLKSIREKDAVEQFAIIKIIATFVALRCVRCAEAQVQIKYEGVVFACDSFVFLYKNRSACESRAGI